MMSLPSVSDILSRAVGRFKQSFIIILVPIREHSSPDTFCPLPLVLIPGSLIDG